MIVYKFARKESNGFSSIGVPDFKYIFGQYTEAEIIKKGSGIYCFYKHAVHSVSEFTKRDFSLLELEADKTDLIRNEGDRVCVFKAVIPIREVSREEYNSWI